MRRVKDIDRHVGTRMRERRIMLGVTLQQLAALVGVTYQQAYKYETGTNRITAGRLYCIARALNVDIGYFFEDIGRHDASGPTRRGLPLEFARNFIAIQSRSHQEALVSLARALADPRCWRPLAVRGSRRRIGALDEHEHHQRRRRGDFL